MYLVVNKYTSLVVNKYIGRVYYKGASKVEAKNAYRGDPTGSWVYKDGAGCDLRTFEPRAWNAKVEAKKACKRSLYDLKL